MSSIPQLLDAIERSARNIRAETDRRTSELNTEIREQVRALLINVRDLRIEHFAQAIGDAPDPETMKQKLN